MSLTRKYKKRDKKYIKRRGSKRSRTRTRSRSRTRSRTRSRSRSKRNGLQSKKRGLKHRGGYGPGTNPFLGKSWLQDNLKGNYYKHIDSGIGVGGVNPYYGNLQRLQNGGAPNYIPQDLVNIYRGSETYLGNLVNKWNGVRTNVLPRPEVQPELNKGL